MDASVTKIRSTFRGPFLELLPLRFDRSEAFLVLSVLPFSALLHCSFAFVHGYSPPFQAGFLCFGHMYRVFGVGRPALGSYMRMADWMC